MKTIRQIPFWAGLILLVSQAFLTQCDQAPLTEPFAQGVEISYPLFRHSIYAAGWYEYRPDSVRLVKLRVFDLQFTERTHTADTVYQSGTIRVLQESYPPGSVPPVQLEMTDTVTISLDPHWVLWQQSTSKRSYPFFMKPTDWGIDTLPRPTSRFMRFPVLPRRIVPHETYAVYRPGNGDEFLGVFRQIHAGPDTLWDDPYGRVAGIQVRTAHWLDSLDTSTEPVWFVSIVDGHGSVVAQNIFRPKTPVSAERVIYTSVTRRLVDSVRPSQVKPLVDYLSLVRSTGLTPLYADSTLLPE